jgi:3-phosphoglycerate kinase|tara:strand:- start:141 stop:1328 length:1188 start_codon:yes stop_codon:yes gene_type:complete
MLRSVKSFDLKGQTILMRLDLNVPLSGETILDEFRIKASLPTIKYCLNEGASIVIMSHLGRPEGKTSSQYSLIPVGEALASMLEMPIKFSEDCISQEAIDTSLSLKPGEIHLLENLRFYTEEEDNNPEFANMISRHGRLYINDAFGTAHREHASNVGVINNFKNYGIGFLIEKEMRYLKEIINKPQRPLVLLLGGAKVSTKIELIDRYINKAEKVIIGGGMAFTFLRAMGYNIGKSMLESSMIEKARSIIDLARMSGKDLVLPVDVICSENLDAPMSNNPINVREIPNNQAGFDIGPKTIEKFNKVLDSASTIIWNGPMGVFENNRFSDGTRMIADNLARRVENDVTVIAGGGETSSALKHFNLIEKITHVSTGGGSSLELLSGRNLKAIEKLEV